MGWRRERAFILEAFSITPVAEEQIDRRRFRPNASKPRWHRHFFWSKRRCPEGDGRRRQFPRNRDDRRVRCWSGWFARCFVGTAAGASRHQDGIGATGGEFLRWAAMPAAGTSRRGGRPGSGERRYRGLREQDQRHRHSENKPLHPIASFAAVTRRMPLLSPPSTIRWENRFRKDQSKKTKIDMVGDVGTIGGIR